MSTDLMFEKDIRIEELFDGRLECFGVYEEVVEGESTPDFRLLKEGSNGLRIYGDEVVGLISKCGINNPAKIIDAISETFGTYVVSEYEPQFWGFETQEEWDRAQNEMHKEDQAELYIEIMKYLIFNRQYSINS